MGSGYLTLKVTTADEAVPVKNANVVIRNLSGQTLYTAVTDENGNTQKFPLAAPDRALTMDPSYTKPAYSIVEVIVSTNGFYTRDFHNVMIEDGETAVLPVNMQPILDYIDNAPETDIYYPILGVLDPMPHEQMEPLFYVPESIGRPVFIPEYITVHLGAPSDTSAINVRVRFTDYVKKTAAHEIYSTWPRYSLIANIHAIVTFALNRVYSEWYPSRGRNFNITNSTRYDMRYVHNGQTFASINTLVDQYFNVYAHRQGYKNPHFTEFCAGLQGSTSGPCLGLKQWGTVVLANRGYTPIQILRYYYPNDLILTETDNIRSITASYPGTPLSITASNNSPADVRRIQTFLNRIRQAYGSIPTVTVNGLFDSATASAVKAFQKTARLTQDGIVGKATWNELSRMFTAITKLGELNGEGIRDEVGNTPPPAVLSQGSTGENVRKLQVILNTIALFYPTIPPVIVDGLFGPVVRNSVIEFQRAFNLTPDGVVSSETWRKLYEIYDAVYGEIPETGTELPKSPAYPGSPISININNWGANVLLMQQYLNAISRQYLSIPSLNSDGFFGLNTRNAVMAFQQQFGLTADGIIGPITWNKIVEVNQRLIGGEGTAAPPHL